MITLRDIIRTIAPHKLRMRLLDVLEDISRISPGKPFGIPKHGLLSTQVYPKGSNLLPVLLDATKQKLSGLNLTLVTPVASIGTCFAEEFANFMLKKGFNYLQKEGDVYSASANWGRVYTIPNLLQIVKYSTDDSYPLILEYCEQADSKDVVGWFDPLRERTRNFFTDKNSAEAALIKHRKASYEALTSCEILVITLGQNEAWVDTGSNIVWAHKPPKSILEKNDDQYSVVEFSYEKNLSDLKEIVNILQTVNKNIKILFTVSPVASQASFSDIDVVTQSFSNKCLLRTVVNYVVSIQPDKLYYFPSFEMVLCDNPRNFCADNRHVKYSMKNRIFTLFSKSTITR